MSSTAERPPDAHLWGYDRSTWETLTEPPKRGRGGWYVVVWEPDEGCCTFTGPYRWRWLARLSGHATRRHFPAPKTVGVVRRRDEFGGDGTHV